MSHWGRGYVDRKLLKQVGAPGPKRYLTQTEFAEQLGVQQSTAARFLKSQRVASRRVKSGKSERILVDISKSAIPRTSPGKILRKREAARRIGLSVSVLQALKSGGIFEVNHLLPTRSGFHEHDVEAFCRKLLTLAPRPASPKGTGRECVTLRDVMQGHRDCLETKINILRAVLSSTIAVVGNADGTPGGLLLDGPLCRKSLEESRVRAAGNAITPGIVAEVLGCDPGTVRGLLHSLRMIRDTLREANAVSVKDTGDLDAMIGGAKLEPAFAALWLEYSKTLHPQRGTDDFGHQRILHWRATALAETFFTDQALVDSPLGTEYFKHLPGILTGLGIIGTFGGLIKGLSQFKADAKPEQVQASLNDLIRAVGHAFIVSATAILLAMLFTWIEKFLLNKCYAIVEDIQQAVDGLFHAGVGEEYLERLVKASETSATQALHIKDALVADLKQILTEITAQQVEASARDSSQISTDVGKVIADSLGGPMERISVAVERVGSTQGDAINTMLVDAHAENVLSGRSAVDMVRKFLALIDG
jgi:hypothetical protein